MRLKLEGQSDIARIGEALHKLLALQPDGVTWHGVNVYMTLKDESGEDVVLEVDGEDLETIVFKSQAKRVAAKKKAPPPTAEVVKLPRRKKTS